ncbi:xanthine dehydrogenase family protein subunit M [Amycolatopsis sp. Hca4]|uniref:FAD binding domain-containing protein n=1 Tax=Amycolatopsis sp. Hca4 TaxID=2742131 RepID=UPI00159259D4|nr:FAD binding domain-containing protein [Amycolatopsis sp. Hca4]QKV75809.1 FAD binding domain-containing protein [Amycolatopsis sp. Hca4]
MSWQLPTTVEATLRLKADNPEATVVAGGTFLGILTRQGLLAAEDFISLQRVRELGQVTDAGDLALGAMVTHRRLETGEDVRAGWPGLAQAFGAVASPRVRNVATVGGVLADADYASDPPAMLIASGAAAEVASVRGVRRIPIAELIVGHYETTLAEDELITRVVVPRPTGPATYRKLRTRSQEDRPAVAVAAVRSEDTVRVVVGAVSDRPQHFADVCAGWRPGDEDSARDIGQAYAEQITYIDDNRGSAAYRRHVVGVEVRRALMAVSA